MKICKRKFLTPVAFAMALFMSYCVTVTPGYAATEEDIGRETDRQIVRQFGLYDNPKLQKYVTRVGQMVLAKVKDPEYDYHFKLLNHEMVNAFALPGGYVYVTRGLLAMLDSEAALAGVIGHEIGHVIGHHATKQTKKSIGSLLLTLAGLAASKDIRSNAAAWLTVTSTLSRQILLGYGRAMETESDQVGMILAYEAGYNPDGIITFLQSLRTNERLAGRGYHGFNATHPDTITRIIEGQEKADILRGRGGSVNDFRDRYLDAVDGLRYGTPKIRKKLLPPYVIRIHTVKEGETFRSISKLVSGDEKLALEIATLNAMDHDAALTPGYRIKVIAPAESVTLHLLDEVKKDGEKDTKKSEDKDKK